MEEDLESFDRRECMSTYSASASVLPTTVHGAAAVNVWQWRGILGRLLRNS